VFEVLTPGANSLCVLNMPRCPRILRAWLLTPSRCALWVIGGRLRSIVRQVTSLNNHHRLNSFYTSDSPVFVKSMGDFLTECFHRIRRPKIVSALMRNTTARWNADADRMIALCHESTPWAGESTSSGSRAPCSHSEAEGPQRQKQRPLGPYAERTGPADGRRLE
jgi:hypothetical protein